MTDEELKPFKIGEREEIQTKPIFKREEKKEDFVFHFPYLQSLLDEKDGVEKIKRIYEKSMRELNLSLEKAKNQMEKERAMKVMKGYETSMELMNELEKIKQELETKRVN
ncbi:MAG: hypothetical protein AB1414_00350 [bacterium]